MSPRILTSSVVALLSLAACSTNSNGSAGNEQVASNESETGPGDAGGRAEGGAAAAEGVFREGSKELTEQQQKAQSIIREIWQTPGFKRSVMQNWLRGSEVEPQLTLREGEFRTEVLQLIADGDNKDAESRLRSLQGEGANSVWDFMLGNLLFGDGRFADAQKELVKAVAKYPKFRRAWQVLGFSQMRDGKFASAAESLSEVIKLGGGDAQTYGFLGLAHAQGGSYAAAESAFRYTIMMDPRDDRWQQLLADVLGRQGKYADSISLIDRLLAKDRNNVNLWKMQAYAFANMGETQKAATNFEIIDRLGGADYNALATLGTIYFNDELYTLAVDAYLRAIEKKDRGEHDAVLGIANRLASRSVYDEASRLIQGIEKAYADTLPQDSKLEMLKLRARLAVASGATEEQIALLKEIVKQNQLDGDALIQLARYYQDKGEIEQAIFRYEQAARNPEFAADARVLHAQLLSNNQRYAEAEPLLEAAINLKPRDDVQQLLEYVKRAKARAASKKAGS
ncbi:MAG: tetratricopeptide repeat protein [Planctomycetota bacterium]